VKREGVVGWVGESVEWGLEAEAEAEDEGELGELDELRDGVQGELAEVGEFVDVCGEDGRTGGREDVVSSRSAALEE